MDTLSVEKIKEHLEQTSFGTENEYPLELWTCNGDGLFSKGQEGFSLPCEDSEIDNQEDLEFVANAPAYIRYLLSQIK